MLDTNIVGHLLNSHAPVRARFSLLAHSATISAIVLPEFRYGIAKSKSRHANTLGLDQLLLNKLAVIAFTEDDAVTAGTLRATMEAIGQRMAPNDLLIGAQALRIGATLVTTDSDFDRIQGLLIEDWTKP